MSDQIKDIVASELEALGRPTLRKFANWLTEGFSEEGEIKSHATIINWLDGKAPQTDFLEDMLSVYEPSDRRFVLALKLLAAKSPHIWGFEGVVWRLRDVLRKSMPKAE